MKTCSLAGLGAGLMMLLPALAAAQEVTSPACTATGPCHARWESAAAHRTGDAFLDARAPSSRRLLGAGIGFVVGAGATYIVLNSGGSTAPCDRDANQDALRSGECIGLYALGGLAGAGLGALIGGAFSSRHIATPPMRIQWLPHRPARLRVTMPL